MKKNFFISMFSDEKGAISSKRVNGTLCCVILCGTLFYNQFSSNPFTAPDVLIEAVAALAFGCLGLSTVDKFSPKRGEQTNQDEQ